MHFYTLYETFFIFLFWGVTGWLIEVVDMRIETGEFQNRGFLHMPLCPLYGFGMLTMSTLFREKRDSYLMLFFCGLLVATLIEYFTGWLLETLFHAKWWDYSHMRFQIKGRICLRNMILFGFGAILTIGYIQPMVETTIVMLPRTAGRVIIALFVIAMVPDIIISVKKAWKFRKHDVKNAFLIFKSHR